MGLCAGRELPVAEVQSLEQWLQAAEKHKAARVPCSVAVPLKSPEAKQASLRERTILKHAGSVRDFYTLDSTVLGEGGFGCVRVGERKGTKDVLRTKVAIKSMLKATVDHLELFEHEISVMKSLDHPNIIKLHESFENKNTITLVMELCQGGELFDRIVEVGQFSERDGAVVMKQILSAVCYMHKSGVCHRDLKPENCLLSADGPIDQSTLKIIDFGIAKALKAGESMCTKAGSPHYVAPEVLRGYYNEACDYWSCGVIMFTMLGGYLPFDGQNDRMVLERVRRGTYSFAGPNWKQISEDAKNLIRGLLRFRPEMRLSAEQALEDCWILDCTPGAKTIPLSASLVENMRSFQSQNGLKKAALNIIAMQLRDSEVAELQNIFKALDVNSDGLLTMDELRAGIAAGKAKMDSLDFKAITQGIDEDGRGLIDYTEFLAAAMDKKLYLQRDFCWAAFSLFDQDGSGSISLEELKQILDSGEYLLKEADSNGDGVIDFEEFMYMMQGPSQDASLQEASEKSAHSSSKDALETCFLDGSGGGNICCRSQLVLGATGGA